MPHRNGTSGQEKTHNGHNGKKSGKESAKK
jgi:hypothetical protein